jgi:hypothetical protein
MDAIIPLYPDGPQVWGQEKRMMFQVVADLRVPAGGVIEA